MGRSRGSQRDGFTPTGSGKPTDQEFRGQDVPRFVAKYRSAPYLQAKVRRDAKGGDD